MVGPVRRLDSLQDGANYALVDWQAGGDLKRLNPIGPASLSPSVPLREGYTDELPVPDVCLHR